MVLEKHINVTGIQLQCANTSQMSEIKKEAERHSIKAEKGLHIALE